MNLAVTKTDGQQTAVAGLPLTYTVRVENGGPADAFGDHRHRPAARPLARPDLDLSAQRPGRHAGRQRGSGAGNLTETIPLPAAWSAVYSVGATLDPGATGVLTNVVTVALAEGSDPDPANDVATDTDTVVALADVTAAKSDGVTTVIPGTPVTYTVNVRNIGPSHALVRVQDTMPPQLLPPVSWSCVADPGAAYPPSGNGNINHLVQLPAGTGVTPSRARINPPPSATWPTPSRPRSREARPTRFRRKRRRGRRHPDPGRRPLGQRRRRPRPGGHRGPVDLHDRSSEPRAVGRPGGVRERQPARRGHPARHRRLQRRPPRRADLQLRHHPGRGLARVTCSRSPSTRARWARSSTRRWSPRRPPTPTRPTTSRSPAPRSSRGPTSP